MKAMFTRPSGPSLWRVCLLLAVVCGLFLLASRAVAQNPPNNGAAAEANQPAAAPQDNANAISKSWGIPAAWKKMIIDVGFMSWFPFVVATFIALWFGIERLVVLRRGRVIPRAFVDRFLQHLEQNQLDQDSALELCESNNSPVAFVFAHGVRKWGKPSVEVEQAIIDGGERQVSQLRKHLRIINGVSTVTPLLGLLGTVVGMVLAFNELANLYPMPKYLGMTIAANGQVERVKSGSIAAAAGVPRGATITKVGSVSASDVAQVHKALEALPDNANSVKITANTSDGQKEFEFPLKPDWKMEATDKTFRLANSIYIALLTTVFGLFIAIPALILYMYLAGRVDRLVMEMDLLAQDVVNLISMEALVKDPASPTRARTSTRKTTATKKKAV
jgi:biopolymer transport protein ExbB/TolQ